MAFVIFSNEDGVFLGSCLGMGFWSKLDPVGQPSAVTFESVEAAEEYIATWESGRPANIAFVPVVPDSEGYASIAACVAAGLPGWLDDQTPVANTLPV